MEKLRGQRVGRRLLLNQVGGEGEDPEQLGRLQGSLRALGIARKVLVVVVVLLVFKWWLVQYNWSKTKGPTVGEVQSAKGLAGRESR